MEPTTMATFLTEITAVASGAINAVIAGMSAIATEALSNEIVIFAVGVGLMFAGIRFIPKLIKSLRR